MAATVIALDRFLTRQGADRVAETTLLELVQAIAEVTEDEVEIVATVLHLLRSGQIRLNGSFRGQRLQD